MFSIPLKITFRLGIDKIVILCFNYCSNPLVKLKQPKFGVQRMSNTQASWTAPPPRSSSRAQCTCISFSPFMIALTEDLQASLNVLKYSSLWLLTAERQKGINSFWAPSAQHAGHFIYLNSFSPQHGLCEGGVVILISRCGNRSSKEIHWSIYQCSDVRAAACSGDSLGGRCQSERRVAFCPNTSEGVVWTRASSDWARPWL